MVVESTFLKWRQLYDIVLARFVSYYDDEDDSRVGIGTFNGVKTLVSEGNRARNTAGKQIPLTDDTVVVATSDGYIFVSHGGQCMKLYSKLKHAPTLEYGIRSEHVYLVSNND